MSKRIRAIRCFQGNGYYVEDKATILQNINRFQSLCFIHYCVVFKSYLRKTIGRDTKERNNEMGFLSVK